jgi:hypothetical protein
MLSQAVNSLGGLGQVGLGPLLPAVAAAGARLLGRAGCFQQQQQQRSVAWSVEREPAKYKSVDEIIKDHVIVEALQKTREAAKDPARVRAILAAAKDRSFLTNHKPGG